MRIPTGKTRCSPSRYSAWRKKTGAAQEALRQTQARCDELQVQADEYAKIRDHIADIEISAHRRTEEFRAQTIQRIHELVAQQRAWCSENSVRYEKLLQSFGEKLQAAPGCAPGNGSLRI